jgi:hypothetical protein
MEDNAGRPRRQPTKARLAAALDEVAARYLSHPAYFRNAFGQPVLAVAGLDDGSLLDAALAATGDRKTWGPVLRLPAGWRAVPDARIDPELAQAMHHGLYLGYSARPGDRAVRRALPCHGQPVSAVLASPVRDASQGLQLPPLTTSPKGPAYVLLDSFNNWGVSVPLEPGTLSGTKYVTRVARWSRGQAA